jgi:hypothetical protein
MMNRAYMVRQQGDVLGALAFESQSAGALASLLGLTVVRASALCTVQNGANAMLRGLTQNTLRIEYDGTDTYWLVEPPAQNAVADSDDLTAASFTNSNGTTTHPLNPLGPDDQSLASRVVSVGDQAGRYKSGSFGAVAVTGSWWSRTTSGVAGKGQGYIYDGTTVAAQMHNLDGNWTRHVIRQSGSHAAATCQFEVHSGHDWTGSGGGNPGNMDNVYRCIQLESGLYATSFYPTSGGAATRPGDVASVDTTPYVRGGRIRPYSKFKAKCASSEFPGDQYLLRYDPNNHVRIQQSSRKVIVTIAGAPQTLDLAVPAFASGDIVELFFEAGNGVPQAWAEINGAGQMFLGAGAATGAWPTGATSLISDGTTPWLCGVKRLEFWA